LIEALDEHLVESYDVIDLLLAVGSSALRRHGATRNVLNDVRAWEEANVRRGATTVPTRDTRRPPRVIGLDEIAAIRDRNQRLGFLLAPGERLMREVPDATAASKHLLITDLNELWGEQDLREAVEIQGNQATVSNWAAAVLKYGPPLDLPLTVERWIQVALCAWLFAPQLTWLRQHLEPDAVQRALKQHPSPRSLADLADLSGPDDLQALVGVVVQLQPGALPEHSMDRIITRLAHAGRPDLLSQLSAHDAAIARVAGPYLAASGDVHAQRAQLEELIARLHAGARIERRALDWLDGVRDESLFELLSEAMPLAASRQRGDERPFDDVLTPLQAAAERSSPLAAVALYERFVADPPWPGAQFLIDRRDAVVQRLIAGPGRDAAVGAATRLNLPIS
jgi:hypothetical protein